jgi:hypothetical protein
MSGARAQLVLVRGVVAIIWSDATFLMDFSEMLVIFTLQKSPFKFEICSDHLRRVGPAPAPAPASTLNYLHQRHREYT